MAMRHKLGTAFMVLGAVMILAALGLFLFNTREDRHAGESAREMLVELQEEIALTRQTAPSDPDLLLENTPVEMLRPEDLVMTEKMVKGYPCIGYLSIPDLSLELPVITDWSNQKLQAAPCRYAGTLRGRDLVIMAHSFASHFGKLSSLTEGAEIRFTDMDGQLWVYAVAAMDILDAYAVEEMTAGDYDLTLFTCTKDRQHRVTVRCDLVEE